MSRIWRGLEREGQFATKTSLWNFGRHTSARHSVVGQSVLVVQEHAAVWRIYSQWLEDDDKQKMPKGLTMNL